MVHLEYTCHDVYLHGWHGIELNLNIGYQTNKKINKYRMRYMEIKCYQCI